MFKKKVSGVVFKNMNIVICDDSAVFASELRRKISDICAKRDWPLECRLYHNPQVVLDSNLSSVQAIFLDIDMPMLNGLELAKKLREKYPELVLIFVTAYIEYAPAGYRVDAFRYILKSQIGTELEEVLDEVQQKIYGDNETILVHQREQDTILLTKNILYIEGTPNRMVLLYLSSAATPMKCIGKLSEYEERLKGKGFLRLQKSFLANMLHIKRMSNYIVTMRDGTQLKTSERNYSDISDMYLQWKGRCL